MRTQTNEPLSAWRVVSSRDDVLSLPDQFKDDLADGPLLLGVRVELASYTYDGSTSGGYTKISSPPDSLKQEFYMPHRAVGAVLAAFPSTRHRS